VGLRKSAWKSIWSKLVHILRINTYNLPTWLYRTQGGVKHNEHTRSVYDTICIYVLYCIRVIYSVTIHQHCIMLITALWAQRWRLVYTAFNPFWFSANVNSHVSPSPSFVIFKEFYAFDWEARLMGCIICF
jgi:hypothetical protein